jgi:hypothetical protein
VGIAARFTPFETGIREALRPFARVLIAKDELPAAAALAVSAAAEAAAAPASSSAGAIDDLMSDAEAGETKAVRLDSGHALWRMHVSPRAACAFCAAAESRGRACILGASQRVLPRRAAQVHSFPGHHEGI